MPLLALPTQRQKPVFGPRRIDVQAALESGLVGAFLFNEGAGPPRSLINSADAFTFDTGTAWGQSILGPATIHTGAHSNMAVITPSALLKPVTAVSMFWGGVLLANAASNSRLAGLDYNNAGGAPYECYGLYRPSTAANLGVAWNNGSYQEIIMSGVIDTSNYGKYQSFGLAMDTASMRGFADGKFNSSSSSGVGAITYSATSNLLIGADVYGGFDNSGSGTAYLFIWNRKVADAEMLAAHFDPPSVIAPFLLRRWIIPAAGGAPTVNFRRTRAQFGTRVGSRQAAA